MTTPFRPLVTARTLLDQLQPFGPSADGSAIVFDRDVPESLWRYVEVLRTGLVAQIRGCRWFANDEAGRGTGPLEYGALRFDEPVPFATVRLIVEGPDGVWDRIPPHAKDEMPQLFSEPIAPGKRRAS